MSLCQQSIILTILFRRVIYYRVSSTNLNVERIWSQLIIILLQVENHRSNLNPFENS